MSGKATGIRAPRLPEWAMGWFANDPMGEKVCIQRFAMPVTTPEERALVRASNAERDARIEAEARASIPTPGALALCEDCEHRDDDRCTHPDAKANGGSGVRLTFDKPPTQAHLNYGRGRGEFKTIYGAVTACRQHERTPAHRGP